MTCAVGEYQLINQSCFKFPPKCISMESKFCFYGSPRSSSIYLTSFFGPMISCLFMDQQESPATASGVYQISSFHSLSTAIAPSISLLASFPTFSSFIIIIIFLNLIHWEEVGKRESTCCWLFYFFSKKKKKWNSYSSLDHELEQATWTCHELNYAGIKDHLFLWIVFFPCHDHGTNHGTSDRD